MHETRRDDTRQRLIRCFSAVFPELSPEEITSISPETGNWDSMSAVTLLAVVQEEFEIDLEVEDMESIGSFPVLLAVLNEIARGKATIEALSVPQAIV